MVRTIDATQKQNKWAKLAFLNLSDSARRQILTSRRPKVDTFYSGWLTRLNRTNLFCNFHRFSGAKATQLTYESFQTGLFKSLKH